MARRSSKTETKASSVLTMSVQSTTRGGGGRGGGWKRNTDEANLTHEEVVKRQKNRESAQKHRDKKQKTLKELQERNKQLEDKKEEFMKEKEELEKLVKQAENLIRKHKLAGCKLSQELEEELINFSTDSVREENVFREHSINDGCPCSVASKLNAERNHTSLSQSQKDPLSRPESSCASTIADVPLHTQPENSAALALFSGNLLPLNTAKSVQSHPLAKQVNPSIPEGHVQPIKLLVTQAGQSGQQTQVGTLQGISQVTVNKNHMLSAGASPVGRGQQESIQFSEQLTPSTALEALVLQSPSPSQVTRNVGLLGVCNDANRYAHKHNSLNRPNLPDASIFVTGSPIAQETQSAMASQFYQVHNGGTVKARGNIPSADLLENFKQPEENQKDNGVSLFSSGENIVIDSEEMSYDYLDGSSSPGATEDHNGYSYVNELGQTESPQAIVYPLQVQEQTQNETDIQHNLRVIIQDTLAYVSSTDSRPAAPTFVFPALNPTQNSNLVMTTRPAAEYTNNDIPVASTGVQSSAVATAILDMIQESNMTTALQDQIKANLYASKQSVTTSILSASALTSHNSHTCGAQGTGNDSSDMIHLADSGYQNFSFNCGKKL
ncbi:hypothetical protein PoB_005854000 [Plakobranchus ocellatus]|uniref:BZIP domain-containing protein n=1 Tax=Plakobranchus ocellatus TaxID=259542 RepID=A0AAV4CGQ7_9GAST|nr:hypothetical protein PoB_005854000 [Plakobranchus ocellatus]